jgi:phosphopantetheinyl transferase
LESLNFKFLDGEVLVWNTTESIDELLSEIQHPNTLVDFRKIKTDKRKLEFLAVRVALKKLLNKEYYICYTAEGKPFLTDNPYNISISHSKNWIAVAIQPNLQIGVDIECWSDKIPKLYKRFLSEEEQKYLSDDTKKSQIAWSAKEALYKIIGKTAVDFACQLQIHPFEAEETSGELSAKHLVSDKIYKLHYFQNENFVLVYCVDKNQ